MKKNPLIFQNNLRKYKDINSSKIDPNNKCVLRTKDLPDIVQNFCNAYKKNKSSSMLNLPEIEEEESFRDLSNKNKFNEFNYITTGIKPVNPGDYRNDLSNQKIINLITQIKENNEDSIKESNEDSIKENPIELCIRVDETEKLQGSEKIDSSCSFCKYC